jgi:GT2 family glycosyltransferase
MPQLSIIIINFNTFALTCKCIESIYSYTFKVDFEIILVDNASSEKNPDEFKKLFPEIILIKSLINSGFSKGNLLGIEHARGETVLLLNSDTELNEDSVSKCFTKLNSDQKIDVITCRLIYPDGKDQHNCQSFPSFRKKIIEVLRIHKLGPAKFWAACLQGYYWDYSSEGFPDWIWGTFFMFKKTVLAKLPGGKLDDRYFMYVEDLKWCFDLKKAGFTIFYFPGAKVIHHLGGSSSGKNPVITENYRNFLHTNYGKWHGKLLEIIS